MAFSELEKRRLRELREHPLSPDAMGAKANLKRAIPVGKSDDFYAGVVVAMNSLAGIAEQVPVLETVLAGGAMIAKIAAERIRASSLELVEGEGKEDDQWLNDLEGKLELVM